MAARLALWHPLVDGARVRLDLTHHSASGAPDLRRGPRGALALEELPSPEALLAALGASGRVLAASAARFRSPYFVGGGDGGAALREAVHVQLRVEPLPSVAPRFEAIALEAAAAPPGAYEQLPGSRVVLLGWADAPAAPVVAGSMRQLPPVRRADVLPFAPALKQVRVELRDDAAAHAVEAAREALAGVARATTAEAARLQAALLRRVPPR